MSIRKQSLPIWNEILKFNKILSQKKGIMDLEEIKEQKNVEIPYFPIKMNPYLYNKIFGKFSEFINGPNSNSVEITYDENSKKILNQTFIQAAVDGNYLDFTEIPINQSKSEFKDLENPQNLFEKLKSYILKNYHVDLGSIKIIKSKVLERIKVLEKGNEEDSVNFESEIKSIIKFFLEYIENKDIEIFPPVRSIDFIRNIIEFYPNLKTIFYDMDVLKNLIPQGKFSITLHDDNWYCTFILEFDGKKSLKINVQNPFEFGLIEQDNPYKWIKLMKSIGRKYKKEFNVEANFLIKIDWICDIFKELISSPVPVNKERIQYLMQKILFGLKNVEDYWDVYPKPMLYNDSVRYWLRNFGYHINLRKINYWAIPESASYHIKKFFGSKFKILILICEDKNFIEKMDKKVRWTAQRSKDLIKQTKGIVITYDNSLITKIEYISNESIIEFIENIESNKETEYLNTQNRIKNEIAETYKFDEKKLSKPKIQFEIVFKSIISNLEVEIAKKFGYINYTIFGNQNFIRLIIKEALLEKSSFNLLSYIKKVQRIRDLKESPDYLTIYPEIPVYQFLRMKGTGFTKQILPLFFDFTEF